MIIALLQLPPPIHGAALRNEEFLKFLSEQGPVRYLDLAPDQPVSGIGVFSLRKLFDSAKVIAAFLWLAIWQVAKSPTVYITPSQGGWGLARDLILVTIARHVFRFQVVAHFRALGVASLQGFRLRLARAVFGGVEAVAMSRTVSADISNIFPADRINIVPNGIARFAPTLKKERNDDIFRLLHISNLSRDKGTFDALEAFTILAQRHQNVTLTVIGSWASQAERSDFERLVEQSGVSERIELIGPAYGSDKWEVFCSSDALIFPTTYAKECFPGVVLEAMSAGLPVVAYRHAAIPDIVEHGKTGWVVDPHDVQGLASGLDLLIGDRQFAERASRLGYEKFHREFRADVTHPKLLRVLEERP